jgi:hypothetical protein
MAFFYFIATIYSADNHFQEVKNGTFGIHFYYE